MLGAAMVARTGREGQIRDAASCCSRVDLVKLGFLSLALCVKRCQTQLPPLRTPPCALPRGKAEYHSSQLRQGHNAHW